jgi:hypothetical protein
MLPLSVVLVVAVLSVFPKRGLSWSTLVYTNVAFVGGMGGGGFVGVPKRGPG